MPSHESKNIFPPGKKRLYFSLAIAWTVFALLVGTVVLLWALPDAKLPSQQKVAVLPTNTATTSATPSVTPSPRPKATPTPKTKPATATPVATAPAQPVTTSGGPMLHGTNLSLFDGSDQVLNSSATQAMLRQMHVGIVRIPMRPSLSEATMMQAAQMVKNIGASALIILERPESGISNAIGNDSSIIADMNTIFGNRVVYYEYGNESNLAGTPGGTGDPAPYIASWNKNIPILKKLAHNGRFIGPVMYQYVSSYLSTFLQGAKPLPDFVSWHEYTCSASSTADYCLLHINNWGKHDADARAVMTGIIGTTLPIMITEWNYTPGDVTGDGKHDNSTFMTQWTKKALQSFSNNGIYAAMQYSCTNAQIPLVNSNSSLSAQGAVFQSS